MQGPGGQDRADGQEDCSQRRGEREEHEDHQARKGGRGISLGMMVWAGHLIERWAGHLIRHGEVGGATNEKVGGAY